jgi:aspartyl-tRNA(Asn)/glutamyl-tRNA(Gln) amidotransferase subunit C
MALTTDEVRYIARLARLALSDEEVERMREQLSGILEHFKVLNDVDTAGVPPTAQSLDRANVERDDEPDASTPRDEILANAPRREGDFLRVRAVLDT